ncbi:MAG: diacylglycerol kinase family protein [bacterium]
MERAEEEKKEITAVSADSDEERVGIVDMMREIYRSFYYAFDGLLYVLLTQRNMRFHFFAALMVITLSLTLGLSGMQKAFLFAMITFVLSMETLNTCIEAFTDIVSPNHHRLAKAAKDAAAAGVLAVSIGSLMAAGYVFLPPVVGLIRDTGQWVQYAAKAAAMGVVIGAVVVFWLSRFVRGLLRPALFLSSCSAAYAGAFLCWQERDWISYCALVFFSFLLLGSIAKKRAILYGFAGELTGAVLFAIEIWRG